MASSSSSSSLISRSSTPNPELFNRLQRESAYHPNPLTSWNFPAFPEDKVAFYFCPSEEAPARPDELCFYLCELRVVEVKDEKKCACNQIPLRLIKTTEGIHLHSEPDLKWEGGTFDHFLKTYSEGRYAVVSREDAMIANKGLIAEKVLLYRPTFLGETHAIRPNHPYVYSEPSRVFLAKNYLQHNKNMHENIMEGMRKIAEIINTGRELTAENSLFIFNPDKDIYSSYEWNKNDLRRGFELLPEFKNIKRIRYVFSLNMRMSRMHVLYEDSTSKTMDTGTISGNLRKIGAEAWNLPQQLDQGRLDWSQKDNIYHINSAEENYLFFYPLMTDMLIERVLIKAANHKSNNPMHIQLWDAGCGTTISLLKDSVDLLETIMEKRYPEIPFSVSAVGFDFMPNLIETCNEKVREEVYFPAHIKFIEGDSNDIEGILSRDTLAPSSATIHHMCFSSGSLTRKTTASAFETLHILQAMWRAGICSLITSGQKPYTFCPRILKRIGFKLVGKAHDDQWKREPVLNLERISLKERADEIIQHVRSKKEKIKLDLSMSPDPLALLDYIIKNASDILNRIQILDLSYCHVTEQENLRLLCTKLPALQKIIYFSDHPVSLSVPEVKLEHKEVKSEIYLVGTVTFLNQMQHDFADKDLMDVYILQLEEAMNAVTDLFYKHYENYYGWTLRVSDEETVIRKKIDDFEKVLYSIPSCREKEVAIKRIFKSMLENGIYKYDFREYNGLIAVFNAFLRYEKRLVLLINRDKMVRPTDARSLPAYKELVRLIQFIELRTSLATTTPVTTSPAGLFGGGVSSSSSSSSLSSTPTLSRPGS